MIAFQEVYLRHAHVISRKGSPCEIHRTAYGDNDEVQELSSRSVSISPPHPQRRVQK